jgi:hypothetical protein
VRLLVVQGLVVQVGGVLLLLHKGLLLLHVGSLRWVKRHWMLCHVRLLWQGMLLWNTHLCLG